MIKKNIVLSLVILLFLTIIVYCNFFYGYFSDGNREKAIRKRLYGNWILAKKEGYTDNNIDKKTSLHFSMYYYTVNGGIKPISYAIAIDQRPILNGKTKYYWGVTENNPRGELNNLIQLLTKDSLIVSFGGNENLKALYIREGNHK